MNIKSLILASAAALVAGGAAQAADLPVAEPVDYVKVCNAYGAGYFFIPGTDTCLKISGKVEFGIEDDGFTSDAAHTRATSDIDMYTETTVTFDAKEETDLGVLAAHIEMDSKEDDDTFSGSSTNRVVNVDKAYLSIGGLYAGHTDSLYDYNAGLYYDDFGIDHGDLNAIGYNMDLGNGVTASVAVEEYAQNSGFGVTMPSLAAKIAVSQGWGSIAVGGSLYQVRYDYGYTADMGYSLGGKASFNVIEGVSFGIAGGYDNGYSDNGAGKLYSKYAVSAGLEYAFASNLTFGIDAGLVNYDDENYKTWGTSAQLTYTPVANLEVGARVGYEKTDYDAGAGSDWDDVAAKLYIKRSF